jgi:putative oxidoreductase
MLAGRILMMVLFVPFGWQKLIHFAATVAQMEHLNLPLPLLAAIIAVVMELPVGIAIALGVWTRPLAALLAIYTLATGFIGHPYWTMTGAARAANMINFYKNVSIMGGLLQLCATGPGRYSLDRR